MTKFTTNKKKEREMTKKRQIQNSKGQKLNKKCFEINQQFGLGILNEKGVEDFLNCQARDGLEGNSESASGFASQNLSTSRSNKEKKRKLWNTCKSMADSCQCMAKTTTML